ncbi:MAG: sensor histidine kinase [Candidatus Entotheonellia bacterium]
MSQPHMLIVDDDLALLQALPETLQLRMGGVTVHTTDSAESALVRMAVTDYDAIVCDIEMPGMDGLALLAEIRALRPNTPTLLITGHGQRDLAVQALRGGAYDFIQKPIDRDYFVVSLQRAIQMRQLSRQVEEQRLALERHADELEHMVEARTRQLLEANRAKDELLALLDTLLASAPVGFAFLDNELRYVRVNHSLVTMSGVALEKCLGRTVQEVLPDQSTELEPLLRRVLETGQPILNQEVSGDVPGEPGQRRFWLNSYYPVRIQGIEPLGIGTVVTDITERKLAEEQIQRTLNEKEILLKEIHHRVKNNLQIICSLLYLQSSYTQDVQARELFADSQHRVRSMALIHESLYRSGNLAQIDFANYIQNLSAHLVHSYGVQAGRIRLELHLDEDFLSIDVAIPCGLILNELVSNCLKHAFTAGQAGEISIEFHSDHHRHFILIVGDNGVGLPEDVDIHHTDTLGLQLVSTLIHQLDGRIEIDRHRGTTFTIAFGEPSE